MDTETARQCLLWHSITALDDALLGRLLCHYGSVAAMAAADPKQWRSLEVSDDAIAAVCRAQRQGCCPDSKIDVEQQLDALLRAEAQIVTLADAAYPALLKTISRPPPLLYLRGDVGLLSQPQLAMVGSRQPSPAGRRAAADFASQVSAAGLTVTSGLARGIDGAAHRAALAAGATTVAVMATGIDRVYPAGHREMAAEIAAHGALVTEFAPGSAPRRNHFPRRNRIISGLSLGVLVVEAALPSGSLITAGTALEQGREVFTLPWSIYHQPGQGCLWLLRDGAILVQAVEDITTALHMPAAPQRELFAMADSAQSLPPARQQLLDLVGYEVVTADQLAQSAAMPVQQVLAELAALEISGEVQRCAGGYIHS